MIVLFLSTSSLWPPSNVIEISPGFKVTTDITFSFRSNKVIFARPFITSQDT